MKNITHFPLSLNASSNFRDSKDFSLPLNSYPNISGEKDTVFERLKKSESQRPCPSLKFTHARLGLSLRRPVEVQNVSPHPNAPHPNAVMKETPTAKMCERVVERRLPFTRHIVKKTIVEECSKKPGACTIL